MDNEEISYGEKKKLFSKFFSTGFLSVDLNDKLVLISLIALVSKKMKQKNANLTTLDVLYKIMNIKPDKKDYFCEFLESLSILVDDLAYESTKLDSCGLKSSEEIIKKIRFLLNMWAPF